MLTTSGTLIPRFGIGQVSGVEEYVNCAIPQLGEKLGLPTNKVEEILKLGLVNCRACAAVMNSVLTKGSVDSIPAARAFWHVLSNLFVGSNSRLLGASHLEAAVSHLRGGGNVLMVQNHRSGADTMVWKSLVNRYFDYDVADDWAYMSGHAVNLYLIPFMFTAALRRFQIFSVKYQSSGLPGIAGEDDMRAQNLRALRALASYAKLGGKLLGLYPEGGRGDSAMKRGEAQTMVIPSVMSKAGPDLMVLPTYVDGSTNILPAVRGANEYNEVFIHARRGVATLSVGRPVMWESMVSHPLTILATDDNARRQVICDMVLSLVASMAPSEDQMGPYAAPESRHLVEMWI